MHLVILHGYILQGTGSNIYVANIAKAWKKQNHRVTVICQDLEAEKLPFVDEYIPSVDNIPETQPAPGTIRVITPDINNILPVYVMDEYKGFTVKTVFSMTEQEIENHIELTAEALRKITCQGIDKVLANHSIFSPIIAKRGLSGTNIQYDIKIHGSAIEYALVLYPHLMKYAIEAISAATNIFAGTKYVKNRILEVFKKEKYELNLSRKIKIVSPGMDPELFKLSYNFKNSENRFLQKTKYEIAKDNNGRKRYSIEIPPAISPKMLHKNLVHLGKTYNQRTPDADLIEKWPQLKENEPIILYFGKFIETKGVGELFATIPEVLSKIPKARFIFVGFGMYREHLEGLKQAFTTGNINAALKIAKAGHFIKKVNIEDKFRVLTSEELQRITITGFLNHEILSELLPLASLCIVSSKLAEAFGMVAVEAMASGALPICNNHSGLRDVITVVKKAYPELSPIISTIQSSFFDNLFSTIETALHFLYPKGFDDSTFRNKTAKKLRKLAVDKFSWDGIAEELAKS